MNEISIQLNEFVISFLLLLAPLAAKRLLLSDTSGGEKKDGKYSSKKIEEELEFFFGSDEEEMKIEGVRSIQMDVYEFYINNSTPSFFVSKNIHVHVRTHEIGKKERNISFGKH